jgi:hypothetical protein
MAWGRSTAKAAVTFEGKKGGQWLGLIDIYRRGDLTHRGGRNREGGSGLVHARWTRRKGGGPAGGHTVGEGRRGPSPAAHSRVAPPAGGRATHGSRGRRGGGSGWGRP